MTPNAIRLAADIGGTFTDLVLQTGRVRHSCKILTTPNAPEVAVLEGIQRLCASSGVAPRDIGLVIHGTTLATNALIERKGARTGLLTTRGFRDVLEMGFEKRFEHYDLNIERPTELVPRRLRFTVTERIAGDGRVLLPLDDAEVVACGERMREAKIQAVAIGFLHAYGWPAHEQRARALLQPLLGPEVTICLSSEVCPEMREYERFSTTCANAYVRPLMAGYLLRMREGLAAAGVACPLLLMMSGGGVTTLDEAMRFPIRLVESGPAGGAILAAGIAAQAGLKDVMAFDMGGTTAKICLIRDGEPERSRRFEIGRIYRNLKGSGLPVRIPVIELVEIGAGGGSIGRVDALGRITVGPDSAGADPGPACYGRGGESPTVTDANLVLGRIDAERFAAGTIALDAQAANRALQEQIGTPLGMDAFWAAAGVAEIVEENMANAARVHAIERGRSISDCTMIAFGGGAPLHAGRLAQKLGITRVLVPAGAGVGSAIGFLQAPIAFEVVRSHRQRVRECDAAQVNALLRQMHEAAAVVVDPAAAAIGVDRDSLNVKRLAELRYEGQGHELRIELPAGELDKMAFDALAADFEAAYEVSYGVRIPSSAVEVVTWSLTVSTSVGDGDRQADAGLVHESTGVAAKDAGPSRHIGHRDVYEPSEGTIRPFSIHWRLDLSRGQTVDGPALIAEDETSTIVPAGWRAIVDANGHLLLEASI